MSVPLMRRTAITAIAALGMLLCALPQGPPNAQAAFSDFGLAAVDASRASSLAGRHADLEMIFELKTDPATPVDPTGLHQPYARTKEIRIELPAGLTGNPQAVPTCTNEEFASYATGGEGCPMETQVGVARLGLYTYANRLTEPIFNMEPSGDAVARLGYYAAVAPSFINIDVDPERDYAVTATLENVSAEAEVVKSEAEIWAVPADSSHDTLRLTPREAFPSFESESPPRPSGLEPVAFLSNPTSCATPPTIQFSVRSYQLPNQVSSLPAPLGDTTGCALVPFEPSMTLRPTTTQAESPSGMDVELAIDQTGMLEPTGTAPAHLKRAVVTLPEGMTLNPSAADGLEGCTTTEIGLVSKSPIRFDSSTPRCPDGAKVGTARITTPVLEDPIEGAMYLADQADNPFATLLSGYLVAEGQGVLIKLAGRFDTDPRTGRLTAVFDNNPQQPFSRLDLHFKAGNRGVLITPPACGTYEIESKLTPWSAADPGNPTADEIVPRVSSFTIDAGPDGGPCPSGRFDPELHGGSVDPMAGQFTSFLLRLTRQDGTPRFAGVSADWPLGVTAKLAGIPYCPEAAIQAAAGRNGLGQGALELAAPSCPAASRVGTAIAGAGAGPTPLFVNTGKIYLAGPYRGAPLSVAVVAPAVTGPFDLGDVVVRAAVFVDPETARVTAVSDPVPTILHGIPLDLRDVRVLADRPSFILNPTSCAEKRMTARVIAENGAVGNPTSRFQVGGCRGLGLKPRLSMRLFGKTNRGAHPRLRAVLRARRGDANIGRAAVALPRSAFLDQGHIRTVCTRVQFAADACPRRSIYGQARAMSPLLDEPLTGPVYLRSSSNELPDLVASLKGQVEIDLVGRIDSVRRGIRTTFESAPDAPVSMFVLTMQGGNKGLLQNSRNLCKAPSRATAKFTGHNGKQVVLRPPMRASCGKGPGGS